VFRFAHDELDGIDVQLVVALRQSLSVSLVVANTTGAPFAFTSALHGYFHVSDVDNVVVHGLEGAPSFDKLARTALPALAEPLHNVHPMDRVFAPTKNTITVVDPGFARQLRIEKRGSMSTVVWNPGREKAATMLDLPMDAWRSFLCVEAAAVEPHGVVVAPGATHELMQKVSVLSAPPR
jgi:glucose-6-phosphate 1-epimerase